MKINGLTILIMCLPILSIAQVDSVFQIGIFTEYRITPIYTQGAESIITGTLRDVFHSESKQLTGARLGYQFRLAHRKYRKLSLGFNHILGYDHVYYESLNGNKYSQNSVEMNSHKAFLSDFLFDLGYKLSIKRNGSLKMAIGWGLFNRGSEYGVHYQQLTNTGQPTGIFYDVEGGFAHNSFVMRLEMERNKFSLGLTACYIDEHNFLQPSDILLLAFRVGYTFHPKKT